MKKLSLIGVIAILAIAVIAFSSFAPTVKAAGQPPIDFATFYEGTIAWGPRRADPARAYDTASGQLIFNCFETLLAWNREQYYDFTPVLATNVPVRGTISASITLVGSLNLVSPAGSTWQSGTTVYVCVGYNDFNGDGQLSAGDVIYFQVGVSEYRSWFLVHLNALGGGAFSIDMERYRYIFNIRTSPTINYVNETGSIVDNFDINDARYSFLRYLVQDQIGSPMWMYYKPFFGTMNSDPFGSNTTAPTAMTLAHLIDNEVEVAGNDLTLNVGIPFPDNAFKQVLCNSWGSIVSQQFSKSIGCFNEDLYTDANGDGYPNWWTTNRRVVSGYDLGTVPYQHRFVGTGPYRVTTWDAAGAQVILQRNTLWWQTWPIAGNGNLYSTGYVDTYVISYITDWSPRKAAFLSGALDTCAVSRSDMLDLLTGLGGEPDLTLNPYMKTVKKIVPAVSMDAMHPTFIINNDSSYVYTKTFPTGIPLTFFNNSHTRKAFAYAFNTTEYTHEVWYDEATYRKNPFVLGLYPDYYNASIPGYDQNFAAAKAELQAAIFDGVSVWDSGFTLGLVFNSGNTQRQIACQMIKDFFTALSADPSRAGKPAFTINLAEMLWDAYLDAFENYMLPIWDIGWLADFADADNFVRPYMHSNGDFTYFQDYTAANGWGTTKDLLIDEALVTADGPARQAVYQQLQVIYYNDCPSIPITIPQGRRWCQYWVKGWYYDALYPATYIASVYKYDDPWFDVAGPAPNTKISDGIVNMRDIFYLVLSFNAKAPVPGVAADPKWVGTYSGNGGVDPYGDRISNMRDIFGAVLSFNAKNNTLTP